MGVGIQGAVFRYQMTGQGNSLILITQELGYITSGIYSGKTAISGILWAMGTVVLTATTIVSLVYWNHLPRSRFNIVLVGLISAGIFYISSCIVRYGLFLSGPAGVSLPVGVVILFLFAIFLYVYQNQFFSSEPDF
jgi:hypothetical protein